MGVLQQRHHCSSHYVRLSTLTAIFTFLCLFASTSTSYALNLTQLGGLEREESGKVAPERVLSQKRVTGPGSSPPTCRSKCGRCSPCNPVHVPIQPGLSFPLEYYPEAWRCKCGNKLFMP